MTVKFQNVFGFETGEAGFGGGAEEFGGDAVLEEFIQFLNRNRPVGLGEETGAGDEAGVIHREAGEEKSEVIGFGRGREAELFELGAEVRIPFDRVGAGAAAGGEGAFAGEGAGVPAEEEAMLALPLAEVAGGKALELGTVDVEAPGGLLVALRAVDGEAEAGVVGEAFLEGPLVGLGMFHREEIAELQEAEAGGGDQGDEKNFVASFHWEGPSGAGEFWSRPAWCILMTMSAFQAGLRLGRSWAARARWCGRRPR